MKVAGCILLFLQLFLHKSVASSFLILILLIFPSTSFLHFIFGQPCLHFHPLHVPLPSSKHLPEVVSKHDHTTSHYLPAHLFTAFFNTNLFIKSTVFLLSINFTLHITLTIDLSAHLKIP